MAGWYEFKETFNINLKPKAPLDYIGTALWPHANHKQNKIM